MELEPTQKPDELDGQSVLEMFDRGGLADNTYRTSKGPIKGREFLLVCEPVIGLIKLYKSMSDGDPEKTELGNGIVLAIDHYLSEENQVL